MDRIGTIMGAVTIPMALLSAASIAGGMWLLVAGPASPVLLGVCAIGAGLALAWALERLTAAMDDAAMAIRLRSGGAGGQAMAIVCGIVPMVVLLGWEYASLRLIVRPHAPAGAIAEWLWSYGVATGPWTLLSQLVGSDRRTLCGIRAYAGHLAYWLLSVAILAGVPDAVAIALMALPAALPATVGTLLAIADRGTLRNVRI